MSSGEEVDSRWRQQAPAVGLPELLFWTCALLLLFWGLGEVGLVRSESRWAEIVREMIRSGRWFDPTLNGETYFDKPLFSYWAVVAAHALTGKLNEWTLRLPSAISGLLVLWSTGSLGRLLWGRQAALAAGWLLLLSYGFLGWARLGEADMENLAVIILAVHWYWKHRDSSRFIDYLPFHVLIFAGAHFKGLVAIAVPLLVVLPDLLAEGRWRRHLNLRHLAALAVGIGVYLLPFLLIAASSDDLLADAIGLVLRENVQRFFQPFDHVDPVYSYLIHWPTLMLPWAPLMVVGLFRLARHWKGLAWPERWLLLALLLIFAFFTASGSRRIYYILPILPFTALALGYCLTELPDRGRPWGLWLQGGLLALAIALEIASWLTWPWLEESRNLDLPDRLRALGLVPGVLAASVWLLAWVGRRSLARWLQLPVGLVVLVPPTAVLLGGYLWWQQPQLDRFRSARPFGIALREKVQALSPRQIGLAARGKPPLKVMFYARMPFPVRRLHDEKELAAFLTEPGYPKLLLMEDHYLPLPPALARRKPDLAETGYPWEKDTGSKLRAWILQGPPNP